MSQQEGDRNRNSSLFDLSPEHLSVNLTFPGRQKSRPTTVETKGASSSRTAVWRSLQPSLLEPMSMKHLQSSWSHVSFSGNLFGICQHVLQVKTFSWSGWLRRLCATSIAPLTLWSRSRIEHLLFTFYSTSKLLCDVQKSQLRTSCFVNRRTITLSCVQQRNIKMTVDT